MSSRGKRAVDPSKLELIKQGKKKVNVSDFKENKNTISNKNGQFIAIQKERKFEEAGVTRKKRNFVMYESKQGTEKDVDYLKLAGAKKKAPPKKVQETIISKHKKKQYLDNFQYHETKNLKNKKPSVVVHNRMSNPITGSELVVLEVDHSELVALEVDLLKQLQVLLELQELAKLLPV